MSEGEEDVPTELLANALQLMGQEWTKLSQGEDETIAATADLSVITNRLTALMLTRLVAVVIDRDKSSSMRVFQDYSTQTVCRSILVQPELWPVEITPAVVQELHTYVGKMIERYYPTGIVPYHNAEHAYHVTLSVSKLLDMLLTRKFGEAVFPPSFGLRHQPLALFALVMAGLIHDVEHTGVANRVLSTEDNPLAIQYNDQSIAENRSLYVAFDEFLCPEYAQFRRALCPQTEDYHTLRRHVINLVLNTDIASPEKTQLGRSKWKEAFMEEISRRRSLTNAPTNTCNDANKAATDKPNASLASLGIRGSENKEGASGDEQSVETYLTESDEGTTNSIGAVPEQAPPPPEAESPRPPNRTRRQRAGGAAIPAPAPKPILRSANKKRLGIRRSMDLGGEVVDTYESTQSHDDKEAALREADQPDELKMTVVMEVIMQAADVAHNLQSWDHMVEWSCRLYLELRRAYIQNRGPDCSPNWFKNQVGFLDMYLEPLAKKLDTVGVFGPMIGPSFVKIVKASRDRWLIDGMEVTQAVIDAGEEWYPEGESVEPLSELPSRYGRNAANHFELKMNGKGASSLETENKVTELQETLKSLQDELNEAKTREEQEQKQHEQECQTYLKEQEEIKKQAEKQREEERKKLLKEQEQLKQKLAKKLQEQEEKQKELEMQKESEIKRHLEKHKEMQKLLRQQEEVQRRQLAEAEELRNEHMKQKELATQKTRELAKATVASSNGAQRQNLVIMCMAIALIWTNLRAPLLNHLCAPAYPGTMLYSVEPKIFEAPWFAYDQYKKTAFGICGSRPRIRIESHGGKLTWIRPDEQASSEVLAKQFHHATVEKKHVAIVDGRGQVHLAKAPWYEGF
mmetsp:Transcript_24247/g.46153  ORF Transcript_24247/g.46153 Transcript_24247/m.46153 type:complete len:858 (+) Transcript_24247:92-2665(+)